MQQPLILASASPQRKVLLEGLGIDFVIIPSRFNEADHPEKDPAVRAQTLAKEKALDVAEQHRGRWVLGCDTLVVTEDGELLEKPLDAQDARRMLTLHSGRTSVVHSGLALVSPEGIVHEGLSSSDVLFKRLTGEEMDWWIESELWKNRSGGFQIDGPGQWMIAEICGDWTSIVGLPVFLFGQLAEEAGFNMKLR